MAKKITKENIVELLKKLDKPCNKKDSGVRLKRMLRKAIREEDALELKGLLNTSELDLIQAVYKEEGWDLPEEVTAMFDASSDIDDDDNDDADDEDENEPKKSKKSDKKKSKKSDKKKSKKSDKKKKRVRDESAPKAIDVFKNAIPKKGSITRDGLIEKVVAETGIKNYSVANYIAAAKKKDNNLGIFLVEKKDKEGTKKISRV